MNTSFVGYGALMALGAIALRPRLSATGPRRATAITVLLVIAGLSSIATGLAPLDQGSGRHLLAALPVFVTQPVALFLLATLRWDRGRARALSYLLLTAGLVSTAGGLAFGVLLDAERGVGLLERLALWPTFVALAAVGAAELRAASVTRESGGSRSPKPRRPG